MRTIFFFVVFISSIQYSAGQNSGAITASQQQGCAPLSIAFSTSLKQVIKYKWEFSNGVISTIGQPTILFEQPGSYDVKLFVEYTDKKTEEFTLPAFVTVNEVPVVNFTVNGEVFCDGDTVHFQNESVGASSYIWDFGDGTNSAETNPTHIYHEGGFFSVTLMSYNSTGCSNIKFVEDKIKVNKIVNLDFTSNELSTCTNEPAVILGANQDFVAYQWDFGDGYTSTEKAPTHDYLKPGKFTISLKVEDNNGCMAQLTKKSYIATYSPPIINIELSDSLICVNESIDFINKTQNTLDIRWSFQDKSFTDKNFTHFFTSADSLDLTVYVKDKYGCEETTTYKNKILILDAAEVKIDISEKAGCAPMNVHFTNETNEAVSYKWEIGDKIYNGGTVNVTFTEPGPIKVTAYTEQAEGCSSIRILDSAVMVYKSHIQAKASNYSGCLPLQSTFTLSSDNIHDVVWDFGDGEISTFTSPTKIYSKPGKYQVRVTFTNEYGCRESATVDRTINVFDTFVDYKVPDPMQICLFEEVTFTGSLGKGEWKWDFGDGNYSDEKEPQHHYTKAGTYSVRLEAINAYGCPIKIDNYLEITVVGVQSTEFDFTVNSCIDHLVELRSHGPDDFEYHWEINDSSMYSGQIVSHDFEKSGYYPIKLTTVDSFGCKMIQLKNELIYYDTCLNFTYYENEDSNKFVLNYPEIQVTNPNLVQVCSAPFEIDFQNLYHTASSWLWIFDDGSTSTEQNPTHEFKYPGTYDIDLIAYYKNGKIDSVLNFSKIIVGDQKVDFSFNSTALCDGFQVEFEDLSEMPVSWHWNFGDGDVSNLQHPQKVYKEEGQYLVNLIATDSWGCTKRAVQNVSIGNPYYYFDFPEYVCAGDSIVIEHNIEGFDSYSWDFGDGTIYNGINPHHFYSGGGTYSVQLKAGTMENCERVFSDLHQIKSNKPVANFAIEGDSTGCDKLTVRFKNLSIGASSWKWDFGNGTISTERDPVVDFSAGLYTIQLTAYSGECSDVYTRSNAIEVHHIKADYSFTQSNLCFPISISFNDASVGASKWQWNFGDGNTSNDKNPEYTFYEVPKKKISLTIENSNGCKSTIAKESPFFYQTKFEVQNGSGCIPFNASFTDKTIDAQSWYWNFGDGNYSSESNPQHVYEKDGIYTVSLVTISSTGCADTLTLKDFIRVGVLDADFTMDVPQSLCTPLFAQFHNHSIGADSYLWNFGDGSSSTMKDPIHIYTKVGEFDVTLITQNEYGCEDTILHRNLARILGPEANFSISDSVLCHPQEFSIADKSVSAIRWEWFFGDGAVSNKQHPTYEYEEIGTYSISLIATDKFGCREFIKKDSLRVIKTPKAKFTVNAFEYCNPGRVEVVNETENIQNATYKWDFGDGRFSDAFSPEIVYATPGSYKISLTSINEMVCKDKYDLKEMIHVRDTFHLKEPEINELTVLRQNQIHISLNEYQRNNLKYHVVYKKSNEEFDYVATDTLFDKSQTSYSDFDVFTDVMDYSYKVQSHVYCNNPMPLVDLNTYKTVLIQADSKETSMELKWSPYQGHRFGNYIVLRAAEGEDWDEIAELPSSQTSYIDTEALCPVAHEYKVVAKNLNGLNYHSMSNNDTAKPQRNIFLDQKTEIVRTTIVDNARVLTEWKDPLIGPNKVRSYKIWKSENNGDYFLVDELPKGVNSFYDTNVNINSTQYDYKISVENSCNVIGQISNLGTSVLLRKKADQYINYIYWTPYRGWSEGVGEYLLQKKNDLGGWETLEHFLPDKDNFTIDLSKE